MPIDVIVKDSRPPAVSAEPPHAKRRDAALSLGMLTGPLAWFFDLVVRFALVPPLKRSGHRALLFVVTATALALTMGATVMSYRLFQDAKQKPPNARQERIRFMAEFALLGGGLFILVLLASALPVFLLHPRDE